MIFLGVDPSPDQDERARGHCPNHLEKPASLKTWVASHLVHNKMAMLKEGLVPKGDQSQQEEEVQCQELEMRKGTTEISRHMRVPHDIDFLLLTLNS